MALKLRRAEEKGVIPYPTRAASFKRLLGSRTPVATSATGRLAGRSSARHVDRWNCPSSIGQLLDSGSHARMPELLEVAQNHCGSGTTPGRGRYRLTRAADDPQWTRRRGRQRHRMDRANDKRWRCTIRWSLIRGQTLPAGCVETRAPERCFL